MPVYVFSCKNKKCPREYFDRLCRYEEISETTCPDCNSKRVKQELTCPNVSFAQPRESSKWDNFEYRAGYTMEEAKDLRRKAQEASRDDVDPYVKIDDLQGGEGILR